MYNIYKKIKITNKILTFLLNTDNISDITIIYQKFGTRMIETKMR